MAIMAAAGVGDAFFQRLGSSNMDALSVLEEVELIKSGILAGWAWGINENPSQSK